MCVGVVNGLRAALAEAVDADVTVLVDDSGRDQLLTAVWRTASLRRALAALGQPGSMPVRRLYEDARTHRVSVAAGGGPPPWHDCDTATDLRAAKDRARRRR